MCPKISTPIDLSASEVYQEITRLKRISCACQWAEGIFFDRESASGGVRERNAFRPLDNDQTYNSCYLTSSFSVKASFSSSGSARSVSPGGRGRLFFDPDPNACPLLSYFLAALPDELPRTFEFPREPAMLPRETFQMSHNFLGSLLDLQSLQPQKNSPHIGVERIGRHRHHFLPVDRSINPCPSSSLMITS